jgi:phosphatidylglycerophosphatase A
VGKQVIRWERVRDFRSVSATVVATALGAGLVPRAPGTMGTLIAVPLAIWSAGWSVPARLALWVGLLALGTWGAKVYDEIMETGDNQCIVIDEVVGLGITAWLLAPGAGALAWFAAFFLFRFFDILKPPPVRQMDRWSKKKALESSGLGKWWGGFGVMADDVLAGFQGLIVMAILLHFHWIG